MGSHIIQEKLENADLSQREKLVEETKQEVLTLLKKQIRPEFLNRIDEIVMFTPLNKKEVRQIVKIQIANLQKMLDKKSIKLELSENAIDHLANTGFDPQFGARPIKRVIQREILNELSKELLAGNVSPNSKIFIDYNNGKLIFGNE